MTIARTLRPIHFEDFGGTGFERLVFAYHLGNLSQRSLNEFLLWFLKVSLDQITLMSSLFGTVFLLAAAVA